jgi:predicted transcriptional regulator
VRCAQLIGRCVCHQSREMVCWHMTVKALKEAIRRAETWPDEAQEELAEIATEIDATLKGEAYDATPEDLKGIDRGLKAAREGRFASYGEVEAVFAKHRRA